MGWLAPWKGARLAVRIMLYVSTLGATLRIYGDGDERESIVKASQRWEVADRASVVPEPIDHGHPRYGRRYRPSLGCRRRSFRAQPPPVSAPPHAPRDRLEDRILDTYKQPRQAGSLYDRNHTVDQAKREFDKPLPVGVYLLSAWTGSTIGRRD